MGVYGPRGAGKTVLLNKLALFAVQQEWLLLATNGEEFPKDMHGTSRSPLCLHCLPIALPSRRPRIALLLP